MAITLNNNYQIISRISLTYGELRTYAKINSQDKINNYTSYNLKATYYIPTQNNVAFSNGSLSVDGNNKSYGYTTFYKGETTLLEFQRTLEHNNDGSSPTKNIATSWNASFGGSGSTNVDIVMPKIARLPQITNLPNSINDEQNVTINFTNPAGFYIKAYFYRLSGYDFSRSNVTSPYTFTFTDDERNKIRQFMKSKTTDTAIVTLEAYSSADFSENSKVGETTQSITVNITNANPTVSLAVKETNQKVIAVYGNSNASTVVKNISKLELSSTPSLKKYATLKSRTYTYNSNQTSNAETVTITPTVNKVSVKVVDSRNLSVTTNKTLNMVDYLPVKINSYNFFRTNPTSDKIRLTADLTYYQGTYNNKVNSPRIQYRMGSDGAWRTLATSDYTLNTDSNKITITNLVLQDKLVYTNSETFYLYIDDLFSLDSENKVVTKGIATFEAGETDFQVNGDLNIADTSGNNPINVLPVLTRYARKDYPPNDDLNNHIEPGCYQYRPATLNSPYKQSPEADNYGIVLNVSNGRTDNQGWLHQIAFANNNTVWTRQSINQMAWEEWKKLLTIGDITWKKISCNLANNGKITNENIKNSREIMVVWQYNEDTHNLYNLNIINNNGDSYYATCGYYYAVNMFELICSVDFVVGSVTNLVDGKNIIAVYYR